MADQAKVEEAVKSTLVELKQLLEYSSEAITKIKITPAVKRKTIYRLNLFSGIYQRIQGLVYLVENNQANAANILLRSAWELLAASDFVGMKRGNYYLEVFHGLEGSMIKKQWTQIKNLRASYPLANTWQKQWSDTVIDERIVFGDNQLKTFTDKYPQANINQHRTLQARLKQVDDYNRINKPELKPLAQMDYYTVYSLLSEDVHSTVYGTSKNTIISDTGIHVDLEKKGLDSLRNVTTAYSMLLNYTNMLARLYRLGQGEKIREFRAVEKAHHKLYKSLED
ncbi:MAG: hypothetical protein JWO54_929 [Candidatus Saccharibacteria bacterium]|nr:hypothetical protein [Candidatus Saccharibacteria bacterium]